MSDLQAKLSSPLIDGRFDLEPLTEAALGCAGWIDRQTSLAFQLGPELREGPDCPWWNFRMELFGGGEPLPMASVTLVRTVPGSSHVKDAIYEVRGRDVFSIIDSRTPKGLTDALERRIEEFDVRHHGQIRNLIASHCRRATQDSERARIVHELGGRGDFLEFTLAAIRACHVRWKPSPSGGYPLNDRAETVSFTFV